MEQLLKIFLAAFGVLSGGMLVLAFRGPRVADAEMVIRDGSVDGNLTADETTGEFDFGPTPLNGIPFRLTVPLDSASDQLDILVKTSATSGGTFLEEARWPFQSSGDGTDTKAGVYRRRLAWKRRYVKFTFDVTGSAINFGAVDLRAEAAGEYDNADRDL